MQNIGIATPMMTSSKTISWFLALLVVSFVFQLAGCVSPGWLVFDNYNRRSTHIGLWYSVECGLFSCESKAHDGLWAAGIVREFQVETCIALASCITAIVLLQQAKRCPSGPNNRTLLILAFVCCALSGILALVASHKFANYVLDKRDRIYDDVLQDTSPYRISYSVFLTGLGGFLVSTAPLLALRFYRECGQSQQSYQSLQLLHGQMANQQAINANCPQAENANSPQDGNANSPQGGIATSVDNAYRMESITTNTQSSYGPPAYLAHPPITY